MADDQLTQEKCQLYLEDGEVKATCEDRASSTKLAEILETKPIVITVKPAIPVQEQTPTTES